MPRKTVRDKPLLLRYPVPILGASFARDGKQEPVGSLYLLHLAVPCLYSAHDGEGTINRPLRSDLVDQIICHRHLQPKDGKSAKLPPKGC